MIKAVIFDMDGLLIDSEPLWGRARDEVIATVGIELTTQDIHNSLGRGIYNAVEYWYHQHPWQGRSREDVTAAIIDRFLDLVRQEGKLKPGVHHTIEICKQAGLPLAIASSSPMEVIDTVVDKLNIRGFFKEIYSARSEPHSKPHPGVFITTAELLGVEPRQCLVFEDAPSGVLAAKSARMHCVAVPEPEVKNNKFIQIADIILDSLEEFNKQMFQQF
ncbi:MAG TPA: hexitol phosphatase HxpB [Candidatus Saccharimonadales bacterium]|jgi:sugar-phosphatase|nr:hexitol phosphatase HxpB [Candidatus Saccharimonadales bacterium]